MLKSAGRFFYGIPQAILILIRILTNYTKVLYKKKGLVFSNSFCYFRGEYHTYE